LKNAPDHASSHTLSVIISEGGFETIIYPAYLASHLRPKDLARIVVREKRMRVMEYEIPTDLLAELHDHIPNVPFKVPFRIDRPEVVFEQFLNLVGLPAGQRVTLSTDVCPRPDEDPDETDNAC